MWHAGGKKMKWLDTEAIRQCLFRSISRLVVLGNSHMRIMFEYLMNVAGNRYTVMDDLHKTVGHKYIFYGLPNAVKLAAFLSNQVKHGWQIFNNVINGTRQGNRNAKNILILSTGSADMQKRGLAYFVDVAVPLLSRAIAASVSSLQGKVKVVYVTQPPIGDRYANATGMRNNAAIATANAALMEGFREMAGKQVIPSLAVVDGYAMQHARCREAPDSVHHVLHVGRVHQLHRDYFEILGFVGDVGIDVIQAVLNEMC